MKTERPLKRLPSDEMERKVERMIKQHQLLSDRGLHLVAISGGADSVALMRVLLALGYRVEATHCNFHLRGEESDRDEQFVVSLCEQLQVPLHRIHFDTREYARLHHESIELAARHLRYRYFEQLRADLEAESVCVAHHRDDQVETLMMNIVRGCGLHGLSAIQPRNHHLVRPLLAVSRQEIEAYLDRLSQPYVTDSTNLGDEATRNRFRHHLVPLLSELNPSFAVHTAKLAERMQQAEPLLAFASREIWRRGAEEGGLDANRISLTWLKDFCLRELHSGEAWRALLYEWLSGKRFSGVVFDQLCDTISSAIQSQTCSSDVPYKGCQLFSSATHDALLDRGWLLLEPHFKPFKPLRIPEPGTYVVGDGACRLKMEEVAVDASFVVSRQAMTATIDAAFLHYPLCLRHAESGDRFVPFGMKGSKLVSDYLTDRKRSLFDKRRQLVLTDAQGEILWLVGERIDNRCRMTASSARAAIVTLQNG